MYFGVGGFASDLAALSTTLGAGEWGELTTSGLTSGMFDAGGGQNTLDWMDKGSYDPINKQIRFFGQGHEQNQKFHQYDEASNTWSVLADPPWDTGGDGPAPFIGHGYQHNTIDPATGDVYYARYNNTTIHRLTRSTGTWTTLTRPAVSTITGGIEWLPNIGDEGGLIAYFGESVQRWDKAADSWTTPENGTITGQTYHTFAVRSVPNNLVMFGGGNAGPNVWTIGATGGATSRTDCPVDLGIARSVTTACPTSGDIIVIAGSSSAYQYDFGSSSWSTLSLTGAPTFPASINENSHIVAIPVPAYGVVVYLFGNALEMWVYKHST